MKTKRETRPLYMVYDFPTEMYVNTRGNLTPEPVKLRGHREATKAVLTLLRANDFAARNQTTIQKYNHAWRMK